MITVPDNSNSPALFLVSKATYRADLAGRAARIGRLWDSFHRHGSLTAGSEARREVHRLAGTAPLFGLIGLGISALDAEEAMAHALSGTASLPLVHGQLSRLLARMDRAATPCVLEAS